MSKLIINYETYILKRLFLVVMLSWKDKKLNLVKSKKLLNTHKYGNKAHSQYVMPCLFLILSIPLFLVSQSVSHTEMCSKNLTYTAFTPTHKKMLKYREKDAIFKIVYLLSGLCNISSSHHVLLHTKSI